MRWLPRFRLRTLLWGVAGLLLILTFLPTTYNWCVWKNVQPVAEFHLEQLKQDDVDSIKTSLSEGFVVIAVYTDSMSWIQEDLGK